MNSAPHLRALLVVNDQADSLGQTGRTLEILGPACEVLAMEAEEDSMDIELAWGTERPEVQSVTAQGVESVVGEQPLPEDGKTWKAIVAAATRVEADMIVIEHHGHSKLRRLLKGSAMQDVIEHSPLPVLVLPSGSEPTE